MALTTAQIAALKTELQADPRGYGYAAFTAAGNDQGCADTINTVRDGTNPPANPTAAAGNADGHISVNKGTISTQELVEGIVQGDMAALSQAQRDWLVMVASSSRVRVDAGSTARAGLLAIFGAGTTTRTNLVNTATRFGSRAEELWGAGAVVVNSDVSLALRGQ